MSAAIDLRDDTVQKTDILFPSLRGYNDFTDVPGYENYEIRVKKKQLTQFQKVGPSGLLSYPIDGILRNKTTKDEIEFTADVKRTETSWFVESVQGKSDKSRRRLSVLKDPKDMLTKYLENVTGFAKAEQIMSQ